MHETSPPAVLVLDDEPNSVNLLRITLGMDYTVFTATSGQEGLDCLRDNPEIAFCIFVIAWNSQGLSSNNYLLVVGIGYLFVGGIDLVHTIAYKGMGDINAALKQLDIAIAYDPNYALIRPH